MLQFSINDKIVHPSHGVGTIKKITSKTIDKKTRLYYRIKTNQLVYWLPVEESQCEKVRAIRAPSTFTSALSAIRAKPFLLSDNFRARLKYIREQTGKSTLSAKAKLIRDLHYRNKIKTLHVNEHRIFDKLKTQFINEWCLSAGIENTEAEARLDEALAESAAKIA